MKTLPVLVCLGLASLWGQQRSSIEPVRPQGQRLLQPYRPVEAPPIRMTNSPRLNQLIRAGSLYLTAADAVALALENNIDIEVARYGPIVSAWNLERSLAGGALPGVPSSAAQVGSVASGQGVTGSQQAAGVSGGGGGGGQRGASTNAQISQIGPVTQNLDPSFQHTSTFSHTSSPQANTVQSATSVLVSNTRVFNYSLQQGFLSGGSVNLSFKENYLWENSPSNILNPSVAPTLSLTAQHNLLRGFGVSVNNRTIRISRMNLRLSDLTFRQQVEGLVTQVLNLYYNLSATHEDVKSKRAAAEAAQTLYANVKNQVDIGSLAPPELITAEAQVSNTRLALITAETTLEQQELRLKNLLSRTGLAEPALASARILPVDKITLPPSDDFAPLPELIREAQSKRADLASARMNLETREMSIEGTRNGLLPTAVAFGGLTQAGLAGTHQTGTANDYFVGGFGTAAGQVFRRNFPSQRIGVFVQAPLNNRQAQADNALDQLQLRQSQLSLAKRTSQVEVDVQNTVFALRQARARFEAAVMKRKFQEELLRAEEKKMLLGASTPYNVVVQQRDLAAAQSAEVAAMVAYSNARVSLDQTLGRTLETNKIELADVRK